ncbi:MAG: 6-phosphogluconolactonase [Planctomycetota bacterium]|nr:MAG: 6-phosphogluconolactonase [Planctomycetota bacterium]
METTAKYKPNLEVVSDGETLAHRSVELFTTDAEKAIKAKGVFYVAISGGHTPKRFFELLSETPKSKALAWDKVHLFWVDERYVPPDSQWSNYKLAADTFLPKVSIPEENIHRIPTEYSDVKTAAARYEETIRIAFGLQENRTPEFDLILLGMGVEGHTGSLFPNSYASFDTEDLASVVYDLDRKLNRITLTHPVLCAASHLAVLVSGEEKANILKEVFTHEPDEVRYPIHTLWPILNKVTWLVDSQAAKLL